jgi:hypothetical protein
VGFRRERAFHNLVFDGDLAGLEIRVRYLDAHGMVAYNQLEPAPTDDNPLPAVPLMLEQVDRWNLEHPDGTTARATMDDFLKFDLPMIKQVAGAWLETLGLPYPLPDRDQPSAAVDQVDVELPDPIGPDLSQYEAMIRPAETPEPAAV